MKHVLYIPSPKFSSFNIGPFTIRMYALCMLAAICAAIWVTTVRWKKWGGSFDQILDTAIVSVPAGIVGARLYHVLTTPERYFGSQGDFSAVFKIWEGGLGIWGAIIAGAIAAWAWCRHKHYPVLLLADAVAPALLIGQAVGRLGNWFNQELYGAPTTLPWGLKLNPSVKGVVGSSELCYDGRACPADTLFHPTFLYEMIWNLIGAAALIYFGKKFEQRLKSGAYFALYIMWYTLGRTWIEMLRIDYAHELFGIRINAWVSALVFVLGTVLFMELLHSGIDRATLVDKMKAVTELEIRQMEKLDARALKRASSHRARGSKSRHAKNEKSDAKEAFPEASSEFATADAANGGNRTDNINLSSKDEWAKSVLEEEEPVRPSQILRQSEQNNFAQGESAQPEFYAQQESRQDVQSESEQFNLSEESQN